MSAIAPLCFSVPVQFEITEHPRDAVAGWIQRASLRSEDFLFPSRIHQSPHLSTRQYARTADHWVCVIGLDPIAYGTHTMRRTKSILDLSPHEKPAGPCNSAMRLSEQRARARPSLYQAQGDDGLEIIRCRAAALCGIELAHTFSVRAAAREVFPPPSKSVCSPQAY
jgi:hypothetical protein